MRRERCTITARLAGPCARCRQAAWPAHAWPDGRIVCGNCCPCARRNAAPGRDTAGPGHDALTARGRHQGQAHGMPPARSGPARRIPLERATGAAIAPPGPGKAPDTALPVASDSGALCAPARAIVRGYLLGDAARFRLPPACRPRRPRLGRLDAAASQSVATICTAIVRSVL